MSTDNLRSLTSDVLHSLIYSSVDGFALVNVRGDIIDVNDSYCQMLGYTREELLNMHISDVDAVDSAEDVARRTKEIILSGTLRFVTKQRLKNGSVIDVEVTANTLLYIMDHSFPL